MRRIPNSVIAKALSWQRTRASNPADPFFRDFSAEFLLGFERELAGDWIALPYFPLALKVVARLTTRALFGEPLCRDAAFLDLCCEVGDSVPKVVLLLRCIPDFARP